MTSVSKIWHPSAPISRTLNSVLNPSNQVTRLWYFPSLPTWVDTRQLQVADYAVRDDLSQPVSIQLPVANGDNQNSGFRRSVYARWSA